MPQREPPKLTGGSHMGHYPEEEASGPTRHEAARLSNQVVHDELQQGHKAAAGVVVLALGPHQQQRMHQRLATGWTRLDVAKKPALQQCLGLMGTSMFDVGAAMATNFDLLHMHCFLGKDPRNGEGDQCTCI